MRGLFFHLHAIEDPSPILSPEYWREGFKRVASPRVRRGQGNMIHFNCRCGHAFAVPDSMAGDALQCPKCHLLRDVPTDRELESLEEDGGYIMADAAPRLEPIEQRVQEATRAFTRERYDENGEEIDLCPTMEDVLLVGTSEQTSIADNILIDRPQYDPTTGELVRPLPIVARAALVPEPEPVAVIPYASPYIQGDVGLFDVPALLLKPINLFVMSLVLVGHALLQPINAMLGAGLAPIAPLWIIGWSFIAAQYANIVNDIGPGDYNELPRPLRDASFADDIWLPFVHTFAALILCYTPFAVASLGSWSQMVQAIAFFGGSVLLPAIFLTTTTAGSVSHNLRPHLLWNVIRAIGPRYWILVAFIIVALPAYYYGLMRLQFDSLLLLVPQRRAAGMRQTRPLWFAPYFMYPVLCSAIFLLHWVCWSLGLAYRKHHGQFRWVLQRHEPVRLKQRLRRKQKPAVEKTGTKEAVRIR